MTPIIAIVGRPNVGKSSLFNRILRKRAAVVDDLPGVTRDRNYRSFAWEGSQFTLIDTGGFTMREKETLHRSINDQVDIAVNEASAVLFVVEAGTGVTAEDEHIARLLRKRAAAKTILVVNKTESARMQFEIDAFRNLGFGEPRPVSALHGSGVADMLDDAVRLARETGIPDGAPEEGNRAALRIAIVGRPNVGKSSIINKLLRRERMIVNDAAGTTRDSIDSLLIYKERPVVLIDTAGLRKKSHVKEDLEYYFNLRAIKSIDRCDVCAVVVDASDGLGVQDLRIVRKALELHKGMLLLWNKWDLVEKKHDTFDKLVAGVRRDFQELRPLPMLATSALTGRRIPALIDEAMKIKERMTVRLPAAEFEDNIFTWVRAHPHPAIPKQPVRFLGAKQVDTLYPCFRFFVTNPKNVAPLYVRFLTNRIYSAYDFEGCPIKLDFRGIKKPEHGLRAVADGSRNFDGKERS
jgi:GTP-binding protein